MSVALTVGGEVYRTWTTFRMTRGLKRASADFQFEAPADLVLPPLLFLPCVVTAEGQPILTGYIDDMDPEVDAKNTRTVVTGRSKTMDLVDCMPEFTTNQFNGYALDAIARGVAAPFGIGVVVGPGVTIGAPFRDATFERAEKAFAFVERLARQRGILLTDDASGNLVLATVGTQRAPASLVMGPGGNVFRARGKLSGKNRYSKYTVRSQAGIKQTGASVQNAVSAIAYDAGVPRYRPWSGIAESASLTDAAQIRANWEAAHRLGEGTKATLSVTGWDVAGVPWQCNTVVYCDVPRLGLKADMLIGEIVLVDDATEGRTAELTVQPPSAFTPDPTAGQKGKGKGTAAPGADPWANIVNVSGGAS